MFDLVFFVFGLLALMDLLFMGCALGVVCFWFGVSMVSHLRVCFVLIDFGDFVKST